MIVNEVLTRNLPPHAHHRRTTCPRCTRCLTWRCQGCWGRLRTSGARSKGARECACKHLPVPCLLHWLLPLPPVLHSAGQCCARCGESAAARCRWPACPSPLSLSPPHPPTHTHISLCLPYPSNTPLPGQRPPRRPHAPPPNRPPAHAQAHPAQPGLRRHGPGDAAGLRARRAAHAAVRAVHAAAHVRRDGAVPAAQGGAGGVLPDEPAAGERAAVRSGGARAERAGRGPRPCAPLSLGGWRTGISAPDLHSAWSVAPRGCTV